MTRVELLNKRYILAKEGLQITNVIPRFWSIYENGRVSQLEISAQAVSEDPLYIISAIVSYTSDNWGTHYHAKIICFKNQLENEDVVYNGLELSKWKLTKLNIFSDSIITTFTLELISNYKESVVFGEDGHPAFRNMEDLWKFFTEIDEKCNTVKEAQLYYDYFINNEKLETARITIEEYQEEIEIKNSLLAQHKDLLKKIEILVNGNP